MNCFVGLDSTRYIMNGAYELCFCLIAATAESTSGRRFCALVEYEHCRHPEGNE